MATRYFRLSDDVYIPGRWELGAPRDSQGREFGSRVFLRGEPAQVEGKLRVPVYQPGKPLDLTLADAGTVPIATERVATVLAQLAPNDVQLFPVEVDTQPEEHFLINVARVVKCIDDQASEEVRYWMPEDGRPDRVGTYSSVVGLRIDPMKVGDAKVFRTWGWHIALIVSDEIKKALERAGATGLKFKEV
ncbi:hypothetical protein HPC49_50760 [Pyxidicoccus fallax]|uniref:Immunity MXAN-0049 protein domain-containing protein n=1 Tax=Pyxidicoccus fallax TaxID=394095 RepID=A0A848LKA5_9BACT|nr:DUF1629 domain-containing protein [Pyxidicoccus fallax]NMO18136.1 hypothetical protein [Pyxidicoccus fallax]NPC86456.1 hypothetical protein [Pyxidicoccus fallax]